MATITIPVTDQALQFLEARARQTSGGISVEEYARAAIASHIYEALTLEKAFAAARAAVELIDG